MATKIYKVKRPDGTILQVRGPEGATPEQVIAQAKRLTTTQGNGPTAAPAGVPGTTPQGTPNDAAKALAAQDTSTDWMKNYDPAEEMGEGEKFVAGYGGAAADLGRGIKELVTGETNYGDEKLRREAMDKLGLAGTAGNVLGNVALAAPVAAGASMAAPAGAGVLAAGAAGGAEGLAMGAAAPTAAEGERGMNAALGGTVGAVAPGVASAIRGTAPRAARAAADALRRHGINLPRGDEVRGGMSDLGQFILDRTPLVGAYQRNKMHRQQRQVGDALFRMLDEREAPTTGEELRGVVERVGDNLSRSVNRTGARMDLSGIDNDLYNVLDEYNRLLPSQQSPEVGRVVNDLLDIADSGNAMDTGQYQAVRSRLGSDAASADTAEGRALRGIQNVLDSRFDDVVSPEQAAEVARRREQYRLANALKNVDVKEGSFDLKGARRAVEKKARSGRVMPDAVELLDASTLIRNVPKPNALSMGAISAGHIFAAPYTAAAIAARVLRDNPNITRGAERLVRGATQSSMSNEE